MGLKTSKWTYAAVLLASHSTPIPCFRTLCLNLPSQNSRKTIVTHKILVTQSSNIVHCDWHTQNLYVQIFKPFQTIFPVRIDGFFFLFFCHGEWSKQPKLSHFVDFDWEKCIEMAWELCTLRFQGMLNPMALVSSLYDKWFLKNQNFTRQVA